MIFLFFFFFFPGGGEVGRGLSLCGEIDWYLFVGSHFILFFHVFLGFGPFVITTNFPCYGAATEFQSLLTWQAQDE
jgi:hypothetical protein